MDVATLAGIAVAAGLIVAGFVGNQVSVSLINMHGVVVVIGGTLAATLINTPLKHIAMAVSGFFWIFREDDAGSPEKLIPVIVALADQSRLRGIGAFKEADTNVANGFLARAATAALEYNDSNFVRQVLEQEINHRVDDMNEVANFYRTVGVMAPMFGLLGTLIGIIGVLKDLSNPESVGPAMAVAITSAFYGIFLSNMVCGPIAGKIRAKVWMEVRVKSMVLEGILEIMKGSGPLVVERRLQAYL
ncbi:MAG: MotA/TolQ/ExbB proton channel family protein [Elusimicrobiales bacterium]|nr:MotA/TolQ/ExbB proton channel family protein [Elusimicrobiales bacterium]